MEFLTVEKAKGIAIVTVVRPDALNALNSQILDELNQCFGALEIDDEVKVVIVTGEGTKAFGAGADIGELAQIEDPEQGMAVSHKGQAVFSRIENFCKPVIAAVNGVALGGSCELAMCCHMRVASNFAKFGLPEITLGIIPGYGGTQRMPRLVGKGLAMELILTGEMIPARQALEVGLINYAVEPENLIKQCRKIARKIMRQDPKAVSSALRAINQGLQTSPDVGQQLEASLFGELVSSESAKAKLKSKS